MHGSASVTELQEKLAVTQGAVSQTIKLMLEERLIVKRKGKDARRSVVSLSALGRTAVDELESHWEAIFRAIESLEKEIQLPLLTCLSRSVAALETKSFADRIRASKQELSRTHNETQQMEFFRSSGARYASFRPLYPPGLAKSLAALTRKANLALDVGCGNGQLTSLLATHFEQVVGIDPSESQLFHAEGADNITYLQQTAEDIGLPDNSVDFVVAAQAAHWFDLDKFYRETRRVAKRDAIIALVSYGVPYISHPVNTIFQKAYWQDVHEFWPPERVHVETGYADLYFPFSLIEFPDYSIRKEVTVEQFIDYITTWSAYANAKENGGQGTFVNLFERLRGAWEKAEPQEVTWPISVKAGRVHL